MYISGGMSCWYLKGRVIAELELGTVFTFK